MLVILIPVAYVLGRNQSVVDSNQNSSTSTESPETVESVDDAEESPAEIVSEYEGWNTCENTTYGYSFDYPADWQVDRQVIQGNADWVSVNPAEQANSGGSDVLAIHTYFDGVGCPETKTKEFTVGEYTVKGTSCVDEDIYKLAMKHSKTVSAATGVILAATPQNMVGIQVDMSRGENETIQSILDSVTGLTPLTN